MVVKIDEMSNEAGMDKKINLKSNLQNAFLFNIVK